VKEFKYLGFIFQKNGGMNARVKERIKKGAAIMGQVWGYYLYLNQRGTIFNLKKKNYVTYLYTHSNLSILT